MTDIPGGFTTVRRLLMGTMDELSNSERKVARALLAQYPTAGLTTVVDLAGAAGVSPPTVVRFVTRLGFTGFPAFQRALVHELNGELGSPLAQYASKGGQAGDGVLQQMQESFAQIVSASFAEVPESEFTKLVKLLADGNREVRVTGGRFSQAVADYLVQHLRLVRPRVHAVGFGEIDRRATVADATSSTVFVIYDYRRYTEAQLTLAQQMADRGATVCLMTDNYLSPIAKIAKVVVPVRVEIASPFDSLVAAMALTETLVAAVADRLGTEGAQRLELLENAGD